ncbi:APC family permease [Helicobacter didelphidarum]|nr:APC family permease [Helicobacter didelphidarum]
MKKRYSNINVLFLCLGCIIGWGAFVLPGEVFIKNGVANSLIGLTLGSLLIILISRNYSVLLSRFPKVGGEFYFTLKILGKKHGFICGWFLALAYLCIIPLNATALCLLIDAFGLDFLHTQALYEIFDTPLFLSDIIISLVAIFLACLINLRGIHFAFIFQFFLTLFLSLSICYFAFGVGLESVSLENLKYLFTHQEIHFSSILIVLSLAPWLYLGFDCGVQIIQDIKYNRTHFSLFMQLSIVFGCIFYIALMLVAAASIESGRLDSISLIDSSILRQSVHNHFGNLGDFLLIVAIFGAVVSGINGFFIATTKVLYAMSLHNVLPHIFASKNQYGVASVSIIFIACIASIMPFFGRKAFLYVVDMSCVGIIIAFLYVHIVVIILRYKKDLRIDMLGFIGLCISFFFMASLFLPFSPSALKTPSLIALVVWIVIGWVFFRLRIKRT